MHDHDIDLIMALAEGTLDASDAAAAEASFAACDECSRDLELQRQAMALLSATPRVGMTEMEATRLRRSLRDELGLTAATEAAVVSTIRKRRFGWTGALSAAAVLLIVVLAAPTLNLLGGSSDEASSEEAFAAASPTSTVAAAESTVAGGSLSAEDAADGAMEDQAAEAPNESGAEATTTLAAALEAGRLRDGITLEEIESAYSASFAVPDVASLYTRDAATPVTDEFDRCADVGTADLATEGASVTQWSFAGLREVDGREEAIIAYATSSGDVVVMIHDAETCEIVDRT